MLCYSNGTDNKMTIFIAVIYDATFALFLHGKAATAFSASLAIAILSVCLSFHL